MKLLLHERFRLINTKKCKKHNNRISKKTCKYRKKLWSTLKAKHIGLDYVAKLNVPLLPKLGKVKETVLGTSKYLLPYLVLNKYFNIFVVEPDKWTIESNMNFLTCIAKQYISTGTVIRIVTTPNELIDEKNNYRITAEEICILKQYDYKFYKYNSKIHDNIYFCSRKPLNKCIEVDSSNGVFTCKFGNINKYLYI